MCLDNGNRYNVTLCILSWRTLNNFFKLLVIIVIWNQKQTNWPFKQYYVKTSRYFYRKLYHHFFKCRKNWKRAGIQTVLRKRAEKFWKKIFSRWHKCNIYIAATSGLDFKQLYIIYKFYPIKRIFLSERIQYLTQICNCSSQT